MPALFARFSRLPRRARLAAYLAAALLGLFVLIAILAGSAKTDERIQSAQITEKLPPVQAKGSTAATAYWSDEVVQPGDSLRDVLQRFALSAAQVQDLAQTASSGGKQPHLQPDQIVSIRFNAKREPVQVQFFNDDDNGETQLVDLVYANQQWQAKTDDVKTSVIPTLKSVIIRSSGTTAGAMSRAEIPAEVRDSLRELFSNRLDLYKLDAGDTVRIFYNVNYFHGQQISMGDILAVEITHQGKLYRAYYFGEDGNGRYYDEHGQPLKKGFETQPVPGSRISSPFGIRVHPVLGYLRMHTGIDYAAPTGTPIHAPSDGVVEFRGPKGGYGNAVILRHSDSMQTLYGHMSAFSANAAPGQRVRAGDVIGFVGSTGRSTGPHLHYEVRLNGVPVNPAGVALPAKRLTTAELAEFRRQQQAVEQKLAQLRGIGKTVAQLD
ncbi:peptidoglycan DD-metalloendopeptidase family protein [Eikenella sp. S3360]|uniref:Peptidoglycan DD-metalloendopeptidase family protein n=1 Tax=Eikenella glucosivorans TaxID=2766967 RepID=A0ABS0NB99_9NEIS|nr:peptidoglycan DD-metalloendopeptidase family protein [Eikenella glucosivorans]MBH5329572.1 peptidoglycan DD-metalloendopeptidase family protein [Eikenella glucosivorans]